jgi:hypothetical protein
MLCGEATAEQNPQRFREIVHEINLLLQEKQDRLDKGQVATERTSKVLKTDN